MSKPKKIGKDALGKTKDVSLIQSAKKRAEYEEYKRRKAEEQEKKEKKVGSERIEEKEPTPEQLAEQEAKLREDMRRHKAEQEGKTVHVDEHYRSPPSEGEEEETEEEENEED